MKKTLRSAVLVLVFAAGLSVQAAPGIAATSQHWATQPSAGGGTSLAALGHSQAVCRIFRAC